jgi:hypothetical protein
MLPTGSYKLIANSSVIFRVTDSAHIPDDIGNRDYMEYLEWVAEGNTALPADPIPIITTVTKSQFLALFEPAELLAIATAAQTNPAVNVWLITAQAVENVDLANEETISGLNALATAELLTTARVAVILTVPSPAAVSIRMSPIFPKA